MKNYELTLCGVSAYPFVDLENDLAFCQFL